MFKTAENDIKDWMTDNKLQLNKDKTEALLFNFSKLQDPPTSLSICQTTVTFSLSDSVRNLGFYLSISISFARQLSLKFAVSAPFDIIFRVGGH